MFEGLESSMIDAGEAEIRVRHGGSGPPLLLLHGNPQTHAMWHEVAPRLAGEFTVVATDLRGYGDSSKPETTPDHAPYRYFVEVRREPDHVAGEPNLWLTFRRIYGDRASLFRAILACISHPNKLPLEGEHPVCLRGESGHVRWRGPPAVDRGQALLVFGSPTGHRAPLSDVDGNLVIPQLAEQLSGRGYAHTLHALRVVADHQFGSVPGEHHGDLLPELEGAVGREVQRDGGQGGVVRPLGDYVQQPHLALLTCPLSSGGANLSTTSMMPRGEAPCICRSPVHRSE